MPRPLAVPLPLAGACGLLVVAGVWVTAGWGGPWVVTVVADLVGLAAPAAAAAACARAARRLSGDQRRAWWALAGGTGAWAAGQAVWTWYEVALGVAVPFPGVADVGFLLLPPSAAYALFCLQRGWSAGRGFARATLDGCLVATALALTTWATGLSAVLEAGGSRVALAVGLAYPVADLVLLTVVLLALLRRGGQRPASLVLLASGLGALCVADTAFVWLTSSGAYSSGALLDLGWWAGFLLVGAAAAAERPEVVSQEPVAPGRGLLLLPYVPMLGALAVLGVAAALGRGPDAVEAALLGLLLTLVLARQLLVLTENARLLETLQRREEQLRHSALHDPLTGLANRALFRDRVEVAVHAQRRGGRPVAVMFIDLDDFKLVNDRLGHAAGDALLLEVAARLRSACASGDTVARVGGDEFAVLLDGCPADPTGRADAVVAALRPPVVVDGRSVRATGSVGLAVVRPGTTTSAADLLRDADAAMYAAKARGKGCAAVFAPDMRGGSLADLDLRADLPAAVAAGDVRVVYQPVVDLESGRLQGVEALARWRHPEHGDVPPAHFVRLAEDLGVVVALGAHVLDEACRRFAEWGAEGLTLSVNLSPVQVLDPGLPALVAEVLTRHRVPPASVVLEISERVLLHDVDAAAGAVGRLKALGVGLAIDDFGAGYGSLAQLHRLPVDTLKIDRSSVERLGCDETAAALVAGVVEIGRALGLRTVAEGVEETAQLTELLALGCDDGQGWLFGRPVAADALPGLLHPDPPGDDALPAQREAAGRAVHPAAG